MDSFNKVISFILGLVVIVVFIAVLTGRFNLKSKLGALGKKTPVVTQAPTVTPIESIVSSNIVPTVTPTVNPTYNKVSGLKRSPPPTTIPSTGSPTVLLPLLLSGLTLGSFLRRKK